MTPQIASIRCFAEARCNLQKGMLPGPDIHFSVREFLYVRSDYHVTID